MKLIDLDALPEGRIEYEDFFKAPTVDAVPVIRCQACAWSRSLSGRGRYWCEFNHTLMFTTDYCSYGEKDKEG